MSRRLPRFSSLSKYAALLRPLLGVVAGLLLAGLVVRASGYPALSAFAALWSGATGLEAGPALGPTQVALGSGHVNLFLPAQSLSKVTPLIFCGLAVALGLRAGMFNIGAQGQMTVGALCAAVVGEIGKRNAAGEGSLPPALHVCLVLLAGVVAGGLWGALPGLLKAVRGVHEVISTIMLNFIALDLVGYLVTHSLQDDAPGNMAAQSPLTAQTCWLWPYVQGSYLTPGILIALAAVVAYAFLIRKTALGYDIRAVGMGAEAARAGGVPVGRILVLTMALSGALAGLAGAVEVMGIHHRYVDGVASSYGFDGIAVALLGNLSGEGVALSALFFGSLASGADYMETITHVPAPISQIVQALVILFVGMRFLGRQRDTAAEVEATPPPDPARKDADALL